MSSEKPTLLVVEDDEGLQNQLRWAFDGYDVQIAGNREEAIATLRRLTPGVVLCDLGLPPDPGGVTEDRTWGWERVSCLGACASAPVATVDGELHGNVTPDRLRALIEELGRESGTAGEAPPAGTEDG